MVSRRSLVLGLLVSAGALTAVAIAVPVRASTRLAPFRARVVRVSDGDSITVLQGTVQHRIRLADIDAPERGQPWGRQAQRMLAALVAGAEVQILPTDTDRWGRIVARVRTADGTDVSRAMVSEGGAWAFRRYLTDQSKLQLEAEARAAGRGLWALPEAERMPPWEWRDRPRG